MGVVSLSITATATLLSYKIWWFTDIVDWICLMAIHHHISAIRRSLYSADLIVVKYFLGEKFHVYVQRNRDGIGSDTYLWKKLPDIAVVECIAAVVSSSDWEFHF